MRILILHSRYLSGDASGENSVARDEVKLLAEAGHRVRTYQPSPDQPRGLRLASMALNAVWSMEADTMVRQLIREFRPDIVHCHNLFPMLSPSIIRVCRTEQVPCVQTLHNYRMLCLPSTLLRDGRVCEDCLLRTPWPGVLHRCFRGSLAGSATLATSLAMHRAIRTFEHVSLFLAVSSFVREKHVQAGLRAERIRVKSNFAWPVLTRDGPGGPFLYVGRLSPEKGPRTLIDAWKDLGADLVVVGEGPDRDYLRANAPSRVRFVGSVAAKEVASLIRGARAILVPSLWYEAQPRVILEAYAAGVPVLASKIGGLPELVPDGQAGVLVPPGDETAWREAVSQLLDDQAAVRLGEGAYRLWEERFRPDRALADLEDAYIEAQSVA